MQSRRDLFQAHRLMTQRAALALLRGEPDVPDQPLRRANVGTFSGVLVAVIAVAAFGIWGLLDHGAPSLKYDASTPTLIIDKQTGAPYVFCETDHRDICPMVNVSSARLALQSTSPLNVETVNQSSLSSVPHGPELGIPGLPQDLPGPSLLAEQPWSACTETRIGVPGVGTQVMTAVAGGIATGGQPLGSDALLVSDSSGQDWVIWDNTRMSVTAATLGLVFPEQQPVSVPSKWLNSIQQGAAFQAPSIPGQGTLVTGPAGTRVKVGQLYTEDGTSQNFVMLQDGDVAPITPLQDSLLSVESPQQLQLAPSALLSHEGPPLAADGLPATKPAVSAAASPFCVTYSGRGPVLAMQVETGGQMAPVPASVSTTTSQVFYIALPSGSASLVQETGDNISYFLVTGGVRYPLESAAVAVYLGYSPSQAVQLPPGVVEEIPVGPSFNLSQARDVVQP
jgi:type VII secretion protein EccB